MLNMKSRYWGYEENFWRWLASRVSKHLVYWAALRLMINSPDGGDIDGEIPNVLTHDALRRWARVQ